MQVDTNGDIYIVDRLNAAIRKVEAATGIISTVAGTGVPGYSGDGGPGDRAQLREPNDCFLDGRGGLLIADIQDQRIRRLDLSTGIITTFAGNGEKSRTVYVRTWMRGNNQAWRATYHSRGFSL